MKIAWWSRILAVGAALLLAGCPPTDPKPPKTPDRSAALPPPGTALGIAVVDDPDLAASLAQLEGEWLGQTGWEFTVDELTSTDLTGAERPAVDIIICAVGQLGELAEAERIVPVPEEMVGHDASAWTDIFSLIRTRETAWGSRIMAIPLGSPVLTCYYRSDWLESLDRQPPETWAEYAELAELLADPERVGQAIGPEAMPRYGALEPLAVGSAGLVLLARSAAYASHRNSYAVLFDLDSMRPLIGEPPFRRALEELIAITRLGPDDPPLLDPTEVRSAFWQGQTGLALTWASAAADLELPKDAKIEVGFRELPGSLQMYDVAGKTWETRRDGEDPRVPLLAVSGRQGLVTTECEWPATAFRLLMWLSDQQSTRPFNSKSPATTVYRQSQMASPAFWTESPVSSPGASEYASVVQQTLSRPQCLLGPRIPGRDEYLAALDQAVQQAVGGEQSAQEALDQAAEAWHRITERRGIKTQRAAYWRSLGLD